MGAGDEDVVNWTAVAISTTVKLIVMYFTDSHTFHSCTCG